MQATRILEKHTGETRLQLYFVCVDGRWEGEGQQVTVGCMTVARRNSHFKKQLIFI